MPRAYFSEKQTYMRQEWGKQMQRKPQPHMIQESSFFSHYEVCIPRFDPVLVFESFFLLFLFSIFFFNEKKFHEIVWVKGEIRSANCTMHFKDFKDWLQLASAFQKNQKYACSYL